MYEKVLAKSLETDGSARLPAVSGSYRYSDTASCIPCRPEFDDLACELLNPRVVVELKRLGHPR